MGSISEWGTVATPASRGRADAGGRTSAGPGCAAEGWGDGRGLAADGRWGVGLQAPVVTLGVHSPVSRASMGRELV